MRSKLIVALAALLLSGFLHAQTPYPGMPSGGKPVAGRVPDRTTPSPENVDFSVDFSVTQAPAAPGRSTAPAGQARPAGSVDRPVDEPVQARFANGYVSRPTGDAPVQGQWQGVNAPR